MGMGACSKRFRVRIGDEMAMLTRRRMDTAEFASGCEEETEKKYGRERPCSDISGCTGDDEKEAYKRNPDSS